MNAKNTSTHNNNVVADTLEQTLQAFETNMAGIRAEREKLESKMYEREHELNHEWQKNVIKPDALRYDFDSFTSGTVNVPTVSKEEWKQQRHAIMAALSANPFGDANRAEQAVAQLDAISAAAVEKDAELTAEITDAQKAMQAAQARYTSAVNVQRNFRLNAISRVRRAYEDTVRSCKDAGAVLGGYHAEGLSEPHVSPILSAVNPYGSITQAMNVMKTEISYHAEQVAKRQVVPERVEYLKTPCFNETSASPSDLAMIGRSYNNKSGLRGWLDGMMRK